MSDELMNEEEKKNRSQSPYTTTIKRVTVGEWVMRVGFGYCSAGERERERERESGVLSLFFSQRGTQVNRPPPPAAHSSGQFNSFLFLPPLSEPTDFQPNQTPPKKNICNSNKFAQFNNSMQKRNFPFDRTCQK